MRRIVGAFAAAILALGLGACAGSSAATGPGCSMDSGCCKAEGKRMPCDMKAGCGCCTKGAGDASASQGHQH